MTKEKWIKLGYQDMQLYLSQDELDKLQEISLSTNISSVVEQTLDMVSDSFRSAFKSKGYPLDVRDSYVTRGYKPFLLSYARWVLWNRFPNAGVFALTETRKDEYEEAKELLKNPYLGVSDPDYSDDPELSDLNATKDDEAISVPYLRLPPQMGQYGFPQAYDLSCQW